MTRQKTSSRKKAESITPKTVEDSVEEVLERTRRADWSKNPSVYRAIQNSKRLEGITRSLMLKRGINLDLYEDLAAVVHALLVMKMLPKLDAPSSFFYVAYRVVQLVIMSFAKRPTNTVFSPELSTAAVSIDGESEYDTLERLAPSHSTEDLADDVIHRIDLELARDKLKKKLTEQGWPEGIKRTWIRVGRPPKQTHTVKTA